MKLKSVFLEGKMVDGSTAKLVLVKSFAKNLFAYLLNEGFKTKKYRIMMIGLRYLKLESKT